MVSDLGRKETLPQRSFVQGRWGRPSTVPRPAWSNRAPGTSTSVLVLSTGRAAAGRLDGVGAARSVV